MYASSLMICRGHAYSRLNISHPPFTISPDLPRFTLFPRFDPSQCTFHRVSPETPWSWFLPVYTPFFREKFNVVLGALSFDPLNPPIECDSGLWKMPERIVKHWAQREAAFVAMVQQICSALRQAGVDTSHVKFATFPQHCGYRGSHRNKLVFAQRVADSQWAFVPLMAEVTWAYTMALRALQDGLVTQLLPETLKKYPVSEVETSIILSTRLVRVGGVYSPDELPEPLLDFMGLFRSQMLVHWGKVTDAGSIFPPVDIPTVLQQRGLIPYGPTLRALIPAHREFVRMREAGDNATVLADPNHVYDIPVLASCDRYEPKDLWLKEVRFEIPDDPSVPMEGVQSTASPFDPLMDGADFTEIAVDICGEERDIAKFPSLKSFLPPGAKTCQKAGERMVEFFMRTYKSDVATEKQEAAKDRASRLQSIGTAGSFGKNMTFFSWPLEDGFHLCRSITKAEAKDLWEADSASGYFDSFRRRWHFCDLFRELLGGEYDDPDRGTSKVRASNPLVQAVLKRRIPVSVVAAPSATPTVLPSSYRQLRRKAYNTPPALPRVPRICDLPPFTLPAGDLMFNPLHNMFGYPEPLFRGGMAEAAHQYRFADLPTAAPAPVSAMTGWRLGMSHVDDDLSSVSGSAALEDHLEKLGDGVTDVNALPYLMRTLSHDVNLVFRIHRFGVKDFYFFEAFDCPLALVLHSACAAMDMLSTESATETVEAAIHYAAARGMRFNTMKRTRERPQQGAFVVLNDEELTDSGPDCPSLGNYTEMSDATTLDMQTRWADHVFGWSSLPHGRAAVLEGGLLACLVRHSIPLAKIVAGPSPSYLQFGRCLWSGNEADDCYWDDAIFRTQIDMLLGVATISSNLPPLPDADRRTKRVLGVHTVAGAGDRRKPQPPSLVSLFPRKHFDSSSMSAYLWTRDAERWFKKTRHALRPRSQQVWKKELRLHQACTAKARETIEFINQDLLKTIVTPLRLR